MGKLRPIGRVQYYNNRANFDKEQRVFFRKRAKTNSLRLNTVGSFKMV